VVKALGGRPVLRGVSMRLARGERVALVGESGVGKSTLLNVIAGLEPIDAGRIEVAGTRIERLDERERTLWRRRALGFVFQAFHLLPHLDAAQNVAVPLLLSGAGEREARERASAMLARVGLADRADAPPGKLSGGEQQRVALARALVHAPALVLADEPTGNLDPETAQEAMALLIDVCDATGSTLLMVTHSPEAAARAQRRLRLTATAIEPVA
jgi:putative ABC transport system ATP-binding protein